MGEGERILKSDKRGKEKLSRGRNKEKKRGRTSMAEKVRNAREGEKQKD